MDLVNFLEENNIKWFPININENKQPSYPKEYNAKCNQNDFTTLSTEEILERQKYRDICNAIAIDTNEIYIIDVDYKNGVDYTNSVGYDWIQNLKKNNSYKKSNSKIQGLHIFVKSNKKINNVRIQSKYNDIELLCGQWAFAPDTNTIQRKVKNPNALLDLENIEDYFNINEESQKKGKKRKLSSVSIDSGNDSPPPTNLLSELGELINIDYLDDYDSWTKLIWSLRNNSKHNYDLAKHLSKKSKKYDEKSFNKLWHNSKTGNSIGTFYYYCKLSHPEEYYKIKSKNLDVTDRGLAQIFFDEYPDSLSYFSKENQPVFMYNDKTGRWTNDINMIKYKMVSVIHDTLIEAFKGWEVCSKNDSKILTNIHKKSYKDSIFSCVREKCSLLEEPEFDSHAFILPFKSQVYDLKKFELRDYKKDDYVLTYINYDLEEKNQEGQNTITKLFNEIFPDKCYRDDYTVRLASGLYGTILEEFVLANGDGGNGKGVINELHYNMLTDQFAYNANNNILLENLKTGCNPTVANMHRKRTIFYREPDENKKICIATMKELTGSNEMEANRKYSSNNKVIMSGTHILECNKKPKLDGTIDNSISRRIRDIPFLSTFVDDCDYEENKYIFLKDTRFKNDKELLDNLKHQYFYYLIDFLKNYNDLHKKIYGIICILAMRLSKEVENI